MSRWPIRNVHEQYLGMFFGDHPKEIPGQGHQGENKFTSEFNNKVASCEDIVD